MRSSLRNPSNHVVPIIGKTPDLKESRLLLGCASTKNFYTQAHMGALRVQASFLRLGDSKW